MRAWVLSGRGEPERAVRMMQASLKEHCGRGATGISPYYMLLLARAQARAGALDESLVTMDAAYERARNEGSRWGEPDVLRIRGEILTQKDDQDGAERCFQAALALARSISGRAWELRAATSLGRLWARQGRIAEAREGLAPIYGAFTEGLDLPDLRDARALLAELA